MYIEKQYESWFEKRIKNKCPKCFYTKRIYTKSSISLQLPPFFTAVGTRFTQRMAIVSEKLDKICTQNKLSDVFI